MPITDQHVSFCCIANGHDMQQSTSTGPIPHFFLGQLWSSGDCDGVLKDGSFSTAAETRMYKTKDLAWIMVGQSR